MPSKIITTIKKTLRSSAAVARQGFSAIASDLTIAVYPLFIFILVIASLTFVNGLIWSWTDWLANDPVFESERQNARVVFGLIAVITSYLYLAIMMGLFSSVIAASVMAQHDGQPAPFLRGLAVVTKKIKRIIGFSAISILFIPFGFIAQRHKLAKRPHEVIGSSFSLSTAMLAPAILHQKEGVFETIRQSVATLGEGWKEGIIIKVGTYSLVIALGLIGFLPKLVEDYWFDETTAHSLGVLIAILLFMFALLASKVLSSVFVATLYWRITNKKL